MKKQIYVLVLFIFIVSIPNKITPQSTEEIWSSNFYAYDENSSFVDMVITPEGKIIVISTAPLGYDEHQAETCGFFYNQDGTIDKSIRSWEEGLVWFEYGTITVDYSANDLNGKIYLAGKYKDRNGSWISRYKLNSDQYGESIFEKELSIETGIEIQGLATDEEGKIIVVGKFTRIDGIKTNVISRFNSTGQLDQTFGDNGVIEVNKNINTFVLVKDGSIIISVFTGNHSTYSIIKYNNTGVLDSTFGEQGKVDDFVKSGFNNGITNLKIDRDDNIIAVGHYFGIDKQYGVILAKYNSNGEKLYSKVVYNNGYKAGALPSALSLNNKGEIAISIYTTQLYIHNSENYLYRFTSDGEILDSTLLPFISNGNIVSKIIYNDDGSVLIGGTTELKGGKVSTLLKIKNDGTVDSQFNTNGIVYSSLPSENQYLEPVLKDITIDNNNDIYLVDNQKILKINSKGKQDSTFNFDGILSVPWIFDENSLVVNSNNHLVLGGRGKHGMDGRPIIALAGIKSTGFIDKNFGSSSSVGIDGVSFCYPSSFDINFNLIDIVSNKQGNIFSLISSNKNHIGLGEYSSTGKEIMKTFPYWRFDDPKINVSSITLDSDEKILFCGKYGSNISVYRNNNDGSIDSTFNGIGHSEFFEGEGYTIKCDEDNRPLVSGIYNSHIVITRFNYNGTVDTTFGKKGIIETPLLPPFSPKKPSKKNFVIDKYGRIIVIGSIQKDDDYVMSLVRYNEDGTIDETFGDNGVLKSNRYTKFGELIVLDNDENIIAVGKSDNKIIIKKYKNSDVVSVKGHDINVPKDYSLSQNYPNPFNPTTTIKYSIPVVDENIRSIQLKVYDVLGKEVTTLVNEKKPAGNYEVIFDGSNLTSGIYFYSLTSGNFRQTKKLILLK